jgi:hypothetical protein
VTAVGGTSSVVPAGQYTCVSAPTVTAVNPTKGPTAGGNVVEITGTDLSEATKVEFGSTVVNAPFVENTGTKIKVTAPACPVGPLDIKVTAVGGTSAIVPADKYTCVSAPSVTAVSPVKGPTAGGTEVEITGLNLSAATKVEFGSTEAVIKSNTATKIKATSPAHAAGQVDVTVTTAGGSSAVVPADHFTYVAPLALTVSKAGSGSGSVSCDGGPCAATYPYGTKVTLGATADSGSTFTGWSGGGCLGTAPCTVTFEADTTVTATFTADPPSGGGGTGGGGGGTGGSTPPSNVAQPGAAKAQGETIALKVTVPGPGTLKATGKNLATANATAKGAGVVTLKLKLTSAGKKALKKKGKLKVKVKIVFTPVGGTPGTTTKTVTFKSKAKK